jgi:hypothetical protein
LRRLVVERALQRMLAVERCREQRRTQSMLTRENDNEGEEAEQGVRGGVEL